MKQSIDKFREIFEKSPIGILFYDKDGKLVDANQSALQIARVSKLEDIKGIDLFVNPNIESRKEELFKNGIIRFQASRDLDTAKEYGHYTPTKSGIIHIDYTISVNDFGFLMQMQDITERKNAENALKESEKQYRSILDNIQDAYFRADKEGKFIMVSPSAARMYRFNSPQEMIGLPSLSLYKNSEVRSSALEELNKHGKVRDYQGEGLRNDGTTFWVSMNAQYYYDDKGQIQGIEAFIRDITERKKAEESLKRLNERLSIASEAAEAGIWDWDIKTEQIKWTPMMFKIFGLDPEKSIASFEAWDKALHPEDIEIAHKRIEKAIKEHTFLDSEYRIVKLDGEIRWINALGKTDYDEEGNPLWMTGICIDITERKKIEKELKESETRYHSLYENSFDSILLTKPDGSILTANNATQKMFDMTEEEIIKAGREKLIVSDDNLKQALKKREEKGIVNTELTAKRKDGSTFPIELTSSLFTDADGIVKTSMVLKDISERKKAEEALKESEEKYRSFFEDDLTGDFIATLEGRIIDCNSSFVGIFGFDNREQALNSDISKFNKSSWTNLIARLKNERKIQDYQSWHKRLDGKKIYIIANVVGTFNDSDELIQVKGYIFDETERKKAEEDLKKSEEKYRYIVEFAPTGIYEIDYNGPSFKSVNDAMCQILGYSREELMVMNPADFLSEESKILFQDRIQKILNGEKVDENVDYKIKTKEGREIWANLNITPTYEDGKPEGALVIAHDITKRKQLEKELMQARDHLEEKVEERAAEIEESNQQLKENEQLLKEAIINLERSNEELKSFAYITSHDLQEPLRTIASFTQLIERRYKGQLDDDADEFMDFIVNAAVRMKTMIEGLLEYSRIDREIEFIKTDMNIKLEKAVSNLHSAINESNAEITHDNLPIVIADPDQMVRVFQNLIGNAIKFKKSQFNPRIHISAKPDNKRREWIFSVEDNGIGMEKQFIDKIFEVFKRLHTIDEYDGTGIGLAIIKRIIERHSGRVWVESEFGVGSVFYFTIPVKIMD